MEQQQGPTLTDRALARLRKVASGNGVDPSSIALLETQEQVFPLQAKMEITLLCETESKTYVGGVRGKGIRSVQSFGALQEAVSRHKQTFEEDRGWVGAALRELKSHENDGWGLQEAKITLSDKSATYAATQACPNCGGRQTIVCQQCQGRGTIVCTQCLGQGREICYYCLGRGEDPQQQGHRCQTCNGTRYAPCRLCHAHTPGFMPCPTCQGRRGTPCPACQATGKVTQEVTVTCGAETHFTLSYDGLPSGLRRGLDRIGIASLGKGHADIKSSPPPKQEDEDQAGKTKIHVLNYTAALPYAELRMDFVVKKAMISATGKKCVITGVPNFLDGPLKRWQDKLRLAAMGQALLEEAVEARALQEILSLTVLGRGQEKEVRRLYPFGLSSETIVALLRDMRLALNKTTLKTRAAGAIFCALLCTALFYVLFVVGLEGQIARGLNRFASAGLDVALLLAGVGISWVLLNFTVRFVLQRRFPQLKMSLHQKIGKTGYSMIAAIVIAFCACLYLAPVKPLWLALLMRGRL